MYGERLVCELCRHLRREPPAATVVVHSPIINGPSSCAREPPEAAPRPEVCFRAAVDPVVAAVTIDRPREVVFDYLVDIANHPEFSDHYLKHWRLNRIESVGRGAGARFRVDAPFNRFGWADMTFIETERPYRIVAVGRGGKFNRNKTYSSWTLTPSGNATRLEYSTEIEPALPTDRLMETFGMRRWFRRGTRKAMRRLQSILEENEDRGVRATVGGSRPVPGTAGTILRRCDASPASRPRRRAGLRAARDGLREQVGDGHAGRDRGDLPRHRRAEVPDPDLALSQRQRRRGRAYLAGLPEGTRSPRATRPGSASSCASRTRPTRDQAG